MKKYLMAGLATLAGLFPVAAVAKDAVFVGRLVYSGSSGTCSFNPTGIREAVQYKPANIATNGANSVATTFWRTGGGEIRLQHGTSYTVSGPIDDTFKVAKGILFDNGPKNFSNAPSIRILSSVPETVVSTTVFIAATGEIANWKNQPGCTAFFRTSLTKRLRN